MPGFIPDSDLLQRVANVLQVGDPANLPGFWQDLVSNANAAAYQDIYTRLIARGFTIAQVAGWDRAVEFQRDIGLYWALLRGGAVGQYPDAYKGLDRRRELENVMVTINGVLQTAGGPPTPTEQPFTPIGFGQQDGSQSLFSLDPNDSRIGQITRW